MLSARKIRMEGRIDAERGIRSNYADFRDRIP